MFYRERQILYDFTYMWILKKIQQTSEYTKKEADSQGTNQWFPVGNGGEEGQHRQGEWEVKLLGVRQVQGCITQHGQTVNILQ